MPWLLREEEAPTPEQALLLVHVPRTGGSQSYTQYRMQEKARAGRPWFPWFMMLYFAYRHSQNEASNFPIFTWENMWFSCVMLPFGVTLAFVAWPLVAVSVCTWACVGLFFFTFLATPCGFRWAPLRRFELLMMGFLHAWSYEYLYGADYETGTLLMHMTAEEMVRHNLVSREQMKRVCSFSFVRCPYRRMLSLYMYNRCGPFESFETYVRRWHADYVTLREKGEWDVPREHGDWSMYCHRLPSHVFTHDAEGKQLVHYIVKLEDMSLIGDTGGVDGSDAESKLPATFQGVLDHMNAIKKTDKGKAPRIACLEATGRNARPLEKPWNDYYTPEIAQLVHEMFAKDFEIFGYDPTCPAPTQHTTVKAFKEAAPLLPPEVAAVEDTAMATAKYGTNA